MTDRQGGTAGLFFVALGVVSGFVGGYPARERLPGFAEDLAALAQRQRIGAALGVLASLALLVFVVVLFERVASSERARGSAVLAAGIGMAALALLGIAVQSAGVAIAQRGGDEAALALMMVSERVGALGPAWVALMSILTWAIGSAAPSIASSPRWLRPGSWAVATVSLAAALASFAVDVLLASVSVALMVPWLIAVSVWLWREPR